jgi:hypothetical protein
MKSYEAMKIRVDELIAMEEAEIKKLELDAKRYRWLRENHGDLTPEKLDKAVDAGIRIWNKDRK